MELFTIFVCRQVSSHALVNHFQAPKLSTWLPFERGNAPGERLMNERGIAHAMTHVLADQKLALDHWRVQGSTCTFGIPSKIECWTSC